MRGKKQQLGSNAVVGGKGKAAKESREKEAQNWIGSATKFERPGRLAGVAPSLAVGQAHSTFVSASRPSGFEAQRQQMAQNLAAALNAFFMPCLSGSIEHRSMLLRNVR